VKAIIPGMDLGTVADWANAGITTVALGAAGWAAWATHRTLGIERERDEQRRLAEESAQAALVAAWPEGRAEAGSPPVDWRATIVNRSTVPVYDVALHYHGATEVEAIPYQIAVLPPGETTAPYPGEWTEAAETQWGPQPEMRVEDVEVDIFFTDATGIGWHRNARGQLRKIYGHDSMAFLGETVYPHTAS
jgi:hypothetical protein